MRVPRPHQCLFIVGVSPCRRVAVQVPEGPLVYGVVNEVAWNSFALLKLDDAASPDYVVLLYKPWDSTTKRLRTMLDRVADILKDVTAIKFLALDTSKNYFSPKLFPE